MPLTIEQYIERLDARTDLPWPAAPKVESPKAKPSLQKLPVRAVYWTIYGTLVAMPQGELLYEHPQDFVTNAALDKLIKEFKMWNSMSRKPGVPAEYMKELFRKALTAIRMTGSGGERFPEVLSERIWDDIVKKLYQKDYIYDSGTYGPINEYVKKIAYFYHASIQGSGPYAGAADTLKLLASRGILQGLLTDAQCFTIGQLQRCLKQQDPSFDVNATISPALRVLSFEKRARKPSETLLKAAVGLAGGKGMIPSEVLHVGSSLERDIGPAKKFGFRTALFAGDRASLSATAEQLKDPEFRPDALITELPQVLELIS